METSYSHHTQYNQSWRPYSLGKLIEWKHLERIGRRLPAPPSPYSLGKLIEWKLTERSPDVNYR